MDAAVTQGTLGVHMTQNVPRVTASNTLISNLGGAILYTIAHKISSSNYFENPSK
jgi:hypothetical protein